MYAQYVLVLHLGKFPRIRRIRRPGRKRPTLILVAPSLGEVLDESDFSPVIAHAREPSGNVENRDVFRGPRIPHALAASTYWVLTASYNERV